MAAFLLHGTTLAPRRPGWQRHLEGWQLAVLVVGLALGAAALVLPRAVMPQEIPLPVVDRGALRVNEGLDRDRADHARARPLPLPVRAAGEALRAYGLAEARGDAADGDASRKDFAARIGTVRLTLGDEPLLELRAAQADLFARAALEQRPAPARDRELRELGGTFLARSAGWLSTRTAALDLAALRCLFSVRWSGLAGVIDTRPYAPTLDEWRLYYRTLLILPTPPATAIRHVLALGALDPDYPASLARGILELQRGNREAAASLISRHLVAHPSGPWRLRAQNFLLEARGAGPDPG